MVNVTHQNIAKLLSSENIDVFQQNVKTASFNVNTRTLILPTWNGISEPEIQMLISHEIGHALYTPKEGWNSLSKKSSKFVDYVNIVEDARIERLVKDKYPGTKKIFLSGYQEVSKRNFIKDNLSKLGFIDVLNYWFKFGIIFPLNLTEKHWYFIDKINKTQTFQDVLDVTEEIYSYCKENSNLQPSEETMDSFKKALEKLKQQNKESGQKEDDDESDSEESSDEEGEGDEDLDFDSEESEGTDEGSDSIESDSEEGEGNENEGEETEVDVESETESDSEQEESDSETADETTDGKSGSLNKDDVTFESEPEESVTSDLIQKEFGKNISNKRINYVGIPDARLENIIYPYKKIIEDYTVNFKEITQFKNWESEYELSELLGFVKKSKSFIDYHVSLFEMKKSATDYEKTEIRKSGILDSDKLFGYKYTEDIFKSYEITNKGKSHALVFIMDLSGSVSSFLYGMKKKVIEMVYFCKSANIPFEVYGFSDSPFEMPGDDESQFKNNHNLEYTVYNVSYNRFKLFEFFNSSMSNSEIKQMICVLENMIGVDQTRGWGAKKKDLLNKYGLSGTPLEQSYLCLEEIVKKIRKNHNSEIVNIVYLTDGAGCLLYKANTDAPYNGNGTWLDPTFYDHKTRKTYTTTSSCVHSEVLLQLIKERIGGVNIINFYIIGNELRFFTEPQYEAQLREGISYPTEILKKLRDPRKVVHNWHESVSKLFQEYIFFYDKPENGFDEVIYINVNSFNDYQPYSYKASKKKEKVSFFKSSLIKKRKEKIISRFIDLIV